MRRLATLLPAVLLATSALAGGFQASSEKKDSRVPDGTYAVTAAIDNDPTTAWQSNAEQDNLTQWISFEVPTSGIDKISVVTGWAKSEDAFKDYGRVKEGTIQIFNKPIGGEPVMIGEEKVSFKDTMERQLIDLKDVKITGQLGGIVKLKVDAIYPGVDYPNIAMSEFKVHLVEFKAETVALATDPEGSDPKNAAPNMLDGKSNTYFVAKGNSVTLDATAKGYGLSTVGLEAGPATHARPKTVVLRANNSTITHTIPEAAKGMQWLLLPSVLGYTGGAWGPIQIEVTDSWPGSKADLPLAISELKMNAATIDEF